MLKIPHETGCHKKSISLCARYMSTLPLSTSKDCEKELNFDEPEIDLVLKAEEERLAGYNGIQVINSTGVRAVEFCRPDKGNYFTTSMLQNLINKIDDFEKNWVANAIFLGSQSLYFFSAGVHDTDFLSNNEGLELDKTIQICSSRIYDFPEHIIALYGGFITGTPFGMLLGCHYRLGTPSLLLCLNEPTRGQIPLGCLALGFARYSTVSPTILKYLAVSGATIHSTDLYELGILTHLTDHKPHRGMQYGDTIVTNDTKAIQPAHGEPEYLANMIDDLDINADFEDVRFHEAWDRFLTVPVSAPEPDPVEETNIQLIFDEVEAIFKEGISLEESVQLLKKKREEDPDNVWVNNAIKNLVKCSPFALKCWFQLVDESEAIATKYKSMVSKKEYRPGDSNNFYKQSHAKILALEVNISEVTNDESRFIVNASICSWMKLYVILGVASSPKGRKVGQFEYF